jgi:ribosomal-protein-alanine N-acetyltransferase
MLLETERLILRLPAVNDIDDIIAGIGDIEVSRNLLRAPYPYPKEDAIWWINKTVESWAQEKSDSHDFVIILKSENRVIGGIGLFEINWDVASGQTGFWIARKYWRQGFLTETKIALNGWAFGKLDLQRIEAHVFVENPASNGVMRKFRYRLVGTVKRAKRCRATGVVHDVNIYEMLKEDWGNARTGQLDSTKQKIDAF